MRIPRSRCSTPWSHHGSALPPTSSLACTLYWCHVPLPAPSSHWGCHIADAARLPYFISCLHHVPLPPQVNLSTPSTLPWPRPCVLQPLNIHIKVPRSRCSTPWSHHALCLPPPTSSLACTLYWRHVPLPPRVNLHTGTIGPPFLASPTSLLPAPSASTPSTVVSVASSSSPLTSTASSRPLTSTWGFHVADAAHRGITMPSVCPTPFNISNVYPLSSPSSHWEFHVADAARRGVMMCSALPPTSSLACTLYWRQVPPHSDQRTSLPFVSHFIPLASALYFYPVYTATTPSLLHPPAP